MRRTWIALGLGVLMAAGTATVAFASDPVVTIYGQTPVSYSVEDIDGSEYTDFTVILPGVSTLKQSDLAVLDTSYDYYHKWDSLDLSNSNILDAESKETVIKFEKNNGNKTWDVQRYHFWTAPASADLGENAQYAITETTSGGNEETVVKTASWIQDENGWKVQYSDGKTIKDGWYQDPDSGLWYYLGSDGYMLKDTMTPDGYYLNADGAWTEEQP